MTRRVSISVIVNVLVDCDCEQDEDGSVSVVSVRSCHAPDAREVMEAIDHEQAFDRLDKAYAEAKDVGG